MKRKPKKIYHKIKNLGQTSIEFILMVALIVSLSLAIGKNIRNRLIGNGTCPGDGILCSLIDSFGGPGYFNGNYRFFQIRK